MNGRSLSIPKLILLAVGLALPLILYGRQYFLRPPRSQVQQTLFRGVVYRREDRNIPRPIVIHFVEIDLTAPGLKLFVTPGNSNKKESDTDARTTSEFLQEFKLQLAINANYFSPFREDTPWSYYPRAGAPVNPQGENISRGVSYSHADRDRAALCFDRDNRAQIAENGVCPPDTVNAVAGYHVLLADGKPAAEDFESYNSRKPYACVGAAIDREGKKLWLVVVDGKQPLYSEGVTLVELRDILTELGAQTAINLDGGGSTTLVMAGDEGKAKVLNAPIHAKIPMGERPVANHLGFYAIEIEKRATGNGTN